MKYTILLFSFLTAFSYGAGVCQNITASDQVFLCSKDKRDSADKYLNEQYSSLLSKINAEYINDNSLKNEYLNKVKKAQRNWLKFRDSNCELYSFQIDSQRQAYQKSFNECIAKMSEFRGRELAELSNDI